MRRRDTMAPFLCIHPSSVADRPRRRRMAWSATGTPHGVCGELEVQICSIIIDSQILNASDGVVDIDSVAGTYFI